MESRCAASTGRDPAAIRMVTGSKGVKVYFWQVDHALWSARYRNPYLVLDAEDGRGGPACEYDVLYGQATVVL